MLMDSIAFTQVKGGQGTSTVAAVTALIARTGQRCVTLVVEDIADAKSLLGLATGGDHHRLTVSERFHITTYDTFAWDNPWERGSLVILDNPPMEVIDTRPRIGRHDTYLVIRSCYLALSRAQRELRAREDGFVFITEPGRALKASDAEAVLGTPCVVELTTDPAVARAIDAGLIVSRVPRSLMPLGLFTGTPA